MIGCGFFFLLKWCPSVAKKLFFDKRETQFAMRSCLPMSVRKRTHKLSPTQLPKHELNEAATAGLLKWREYAVREARGVNPT